MTSLKELNPEVAKSLAEIMSSGELPSVPESQEYEILNTTLVHGMRDVADYLLDKNYKVNRTSDLDNPASTPLHNAVKLNDVQLTKKLLDRGALIAAVDPGKNTPLHLAFILGYGEAADAILNHMRDTSNYVNLKNKHGISHLHVAAARGNALATQGIVETEADMKESVNEDSPIYAGYTALRFACTFKRLETIQVLTEASGLHGTATDDMPHDNLQLFRNVSRFLVNLQQNEKTDPVPELHLACFNDNSVVVEVLLDSNQDVNATIGGNSRACPLFTPLHMAIEGEREWRSEKVKLLLRGGANVDVRNGFCMTALHLAMYNHEDEADESLALIYAAVANKQSNPMDANGLTYFHVSVAMNDFQLVKKLLKKGEKLDQPVLRNLRQFSGYSPLHFAVRFGHENMAKLLITRGANVNANEDDARFDTPLQLAIKRGRHRMIDLLLKNKANAKALLRKGSKTTLHLLAERFGETSIATSAGLEEKGELQDFAYKLVRLGVDVDAKDSEGSTALHIACSTMYDSIHLVNWLLMVGADVDAKNDENETPLEVACTSGFRGNYGDFLMLYLHVQKLKDLGLRVDERNEEFCRLVMKRKEMWANNEDWANVERMWSDKEMGRKRQARLREIEQMKKDAVVVGVSLYDYVRMDAESAAKYLENERIKKIVEEDAWDEYEVYGYLVPTVYRRSFRWLAGRES